MDFIDARDVEFMLGGDGYDGHSYFVIDFNQVFALFFGTLHLLDSFLCPYFRCVHGVKPLST